MRVHVLGIGRMGLPMARLLHAAGHPVSVSDPDVARVELAARAGLQAIAALDAAGLRGVEVLVSSLPDDAALLRVADDLVAAAPRAALWIDTSTVSPAASAQAAGRCADADLRLLRCTVSGNNHMAEAAQLTVLGSGDRADWEAALPLLRCWGPAQFYLGEAEQARWMKLVVNLMIGQTSAMLAEALALGRKGGLDWPVMWEVLCASAVGSPIVKAKSRQLAVRDFTPTFTVHQMIKDLDLILDAAARVHVPLAQTASTRQWMEAARAQGFGGDDYAAVIRVIERMAGLGDTPEPEA